MLAWTFRTHLGRWGVILSCLLALGGISGCSSRPYAASQTTTKAVVVASEKQHVVKTALEQLNKPYRYGGHTSQGFDCSGLVYYAYRKNGIRVPRTTREQQRTARPVALTDLTPGDLLFFHGWGKKPSHVGLYIGKGRFVHASTSERAVTLSDLSTPYWTEHLVGAGRYTN